MDLAQQTELDLVVKLLQKTRVRFQTLWLKEGGEKLRLSQSLSRRATIPCEVEIHLQAKVLWRQDLTADGPRLSVWPSGGSPETCFEWIRWPIESEAVLRGIESTAPKADRSPDTREVMRRTAREILTAAAAAGKDLCGGAVSRAWRAASEHSPLLEIPLSPREKPSAALARLSAGLRSRGFGGTLAAAFEEPLDIEIFLPPVSRAWLRRPVERLQGCSIAVGCGWVRLEGDNPGEQQAIQAAAASLLTSRREFPVQKLLCFEHTQRMSAAQAAFSLPFLLRRFGLDQWGRNWLSGRAGHVTVRASLSLPGRAAAAWPLMASERQAAFYDVFIYACKAIHDLMRQWTPYLYFHSPERFRDVEASQAALAFSLTRAVHSRGSRTLFTFDLLDPDHMNKAVSRMTEPLGRLYSGVRKRLTEEAMDELASRYSWRAATDTIQQSRDLVNRAFGRLLQSESQITHAFMAFAVHGPNMRHQRGLAFSAAAELASVVDQRLRWLFEDPALSFTPLFLAETTRALWTAQGNTVAMPVTVRLSEDGGPESMAESEIGDSDPVKDEEPAEAYSG